MRGGGGGGGAVTGSLHKTQSGELHNGGGNSGWGKGNQTGTGFSNASDITGDGDLLISQMAALDNITNVRIELTINGVAQEAIIADATTTTDVLPKIRADDTVSGTAYINLANGTTRVAQLDETEVALGAVLKFKVPYYYTCLNSSGAEMVPSTEYFARSGIDLSAHTTDNMAGWLCSDGTMHNGSHVSGVRGDITLTPVYNAPDCTISVSPAGTGITSQGSDVYEISALTDSFNFAVALTDGSSFPDGTNISWQINGTPVSGTTPETCSASPSSLSMSAVGSNATNATALNVSCIIEIPGEPTAAATKTVKVYQKITLPTFSISVDEPSSAIPVTGVTDLYAITSVTDPFSLTATPAAPAAAFPAGTTVSWTITNASGGSTTKIGETVTVNPSEVGGISTIYASPTAWNISCTISHADAVNTPNDTKTISLYKEQPCKISVGTANGATSYSTPADTYKIANMTNPFSFSVTEENGSPLTADFQWYVDGNPVSGETSSSFSNATPTLLGLDETSIGTNKTNATEVEVKCVVTRPSGSIVPVVRTIRLFKQPVIPAFTISIEDLNSGYYDSNSSDINASPKVYALKSSSNSFEFKAVPSGGASFPAGTKFKWKVYVDSTLKYDPNAITSTSCYAAPTTLGLNDTTMGTNAADAKTITVKCTAMHDDAAADVPGTDASVKIFRLTLPAFTISITPPTDGIDSTGTDLANRIYSMTDFANAFTFTATPAGATFPTGTDLVWTIKADGCSPVTRTYSADSTNTCQVSLADLGISDSNIGTSTATKTGITVSCTAKNSGTPADKAGTDNTMSVYKKPTLPSFTLSTTAPTAVVGTTSPYGLFNLSDEFTFEAVAAGGADFPNGTVFVWKANGNVISGQTTATCKASATAMGIASTIGTTSGTATDVTITCNISHPDSAVAAQVSPGISETTDISVYKITIPDITVNFSGPSNTTEISSMAGTYKLNTDTGNCTFTVNPSNIPSGVTYSWSITKADGTLYTTETTTRVLNVSLADLGFTSATIPTSKTAAKSITATCKVGVDSLPETEWKTNNKTVKIYKPTQQLSKPTIRVTVSPNLDSYATNSYKVTQMFWDNYSSGRHYPWAIDVSASLPSGAIKSWSGGGLSGWGNTNSVRAYLDEMFSSFTRISTSGSAVTIRCKVSHEDYLDNEGELTLTFKRVSN